MQNSDDHVLEYVDAYLHDVLSRQTRDRVAWHCRVCPICRVAMEEAQKRLELMQALPPVEAPESLIRATQQRIERFRPSRITPLRIGLALAASVIVLLGVANLYYLRLAPAPIDLRVLGQTDLFAGAEASLRVLLQNPHTGMDTTRASQKMRLSTTAEPMPCMASAKPTSLGATPAWVINR